jgi:hypothetical protein
MTQAPERIFAMPQQSMRYGGTWLDFSDGPQMVEYIRADLPVKVKPLAWGFRTIPEGWVIGIWMYARSIVGAYEVHTFDGRAHSGIAFLQCPNKSGLIEFPTTAEAKAAAQSDYETRIRECIEQPAPPEEDGQFVSDKINIEGDE